MSGKGKEYVDVTKDSTPMTKQEEAEAGSSRAREKEGPPPPIYTETSKESSQAASQNQGPPQSLTEAVNADMHSLQVGDPKEVISVPMIHSTEKKRIRDIFLPLGKRGTVTQTVVVRKMPREHYLKHYAKDAEGNYIGTEKPAVDAGLVFVPSKSTPEDILAQVHKVAFGKQHDNQDFANAFAVTGAGGGAM